MVTDSVALTVEILLLAFVWLVALQESSSTTGQIISQCINIAAFSHALACNTALLPLVKNNVSRIKSSKQNFLA